MLLVPGTDTMKPPGELVPRLRRLQRRYAEIVAKGGASYAVLGPPASYFQLYTREDMQRLRGTPATAAAIAKLPGNDRFLLPVAKGVESLDGFKYPVIVVQEYGWNMFRQSVGKSWSC